MNASLRWSRGAAFKVLIHDTHQSGPSSGRVSGPAFALAKVRFPV